MKKHLVHSWMGTVAAWILFLSIVVSGAPAEVIGATQSADNLQLLKPGEFAVTEKGAGK